MKGILSPLDYRISEKYVPGVCWNFLKQDVCSGIPNQKPFFISKKEYTEIKVGQNPPWTRLNIGQPKKPVKFSNPSPKEKMSPCPEQNHLNQKHHGEPAKQKNEKTAFLALPGEASFKKCVYLLIGVYIYTYIYIFLFTCLNRNIYRHIKLFINTYLKTSLPTTRSTKFILSSCLLLIPKKNTPTSRLGVFHRGDGLP